MAYLLESFHGLNHAINVNVDDASVIDELEDLLQIANPGEGRLDRNGVGDRLQRGREQKGEFKLILQKLAIGTVQS